MSAAATSRVDHLRISAPAVARAARPDGTLLRPASASDNRLALLAHYAGAVLQGMIPLETERHARLAGNHIRDLAAVLFGLDDMNERAAAPASRLATLKEHIARELSRRDLSVESVAAAHGITPALCAEAVRGGRRHLHRLCARAAAGGGAAHAGAPARRRARSARSAPSHSRPASATCPISTAASAAASACRPRNSARRPKAKAKGPLTILHWAGSPQPHIPQDDRVTELGVTEQIVHYHIKRVLRRACAPAATPCPTAANSPATARLHLQRPRRPCL